MPTTRTMQFHGYGYGSTPVTITATLNGTEVYSGSIPTLDQENVFLMPNQQTVIFTAEIPMSFAGNANVAITANNGYVHYDYIDINYCSVYNPKYTSAQIEVLTDPSTPQSEKIAIWASESDPPLSEADYTFLQTQPVDYQQEQALLAAHGSSTYVSTGPTGWFVPSGPDDWRPVVYIDGVEQTISQPRMYPGTYSWGIPEGSTLSGNVIVFAGLE